VSAQLGRLLLRAYDPALSAAGRRCELLLGILRDWADPLTCRDLADLSGCTICQVQGAVRLLEAEGRIGIVGRERHGWLWIADPPLRLTGGPR
jgi:hypothetical protein